MTTAASERSLRAPHPVGGSIARRITNGKSTSPGRFARTSGPRLGGSHPGGHGTARDRNAAKRRPRSFQAARKPGIPGRRSPASEGALTEAARAGVIRRDWWYRPGWTNRAETATHSREEDCFCSRTGFISNRARLRRRRYRPQPIPCGSPRPPPASSTDLDGSKAISVGRGARDAQIRRGFGVLHARLPVDVGCRGQTPGRWASADHPGLRLVTRIATTAPERIRQSGVYQRSAPEVRVPTPRSRSADGAWHFRSGSTHVGTHGHRNG